jgi:putative phosphoribosyl transferase
VAGARRLGQEVPVPHAGASSRGYADRNQAGRALAVALRGYAGRRDVLVLALPRGGVPVAGEVAEALAAPLDVVVVRKLGRPDQPELAMGAVATVGDTIEVIRNAQVLTAAGVSAAAFDRVLCVEFGELRRRERVYRGDDPALSVADRIVIVVDDGLATGSSMQAALAAVRRQRPAGLVAAVPIGARPTCEWLQAEVDEVCCLWTPDRFFAARSDLIT